MNFKNLLKTLEEIAPLQLAESWDNVGLLLDQLPPKPIQNILLTIDLTESVANEAIQSQTDLIISYHPILFRPTSRFDASNPYDRTVMKLIKHNIAVYSPHTALDSVNKGVNDWLANSVGNGSVAIIKTDTKNPEMGQGRIVTLTKPTEIDVLTKKIKSYLNLDQLRIATPDTHKPITTIALCAGAGTDVFKYIEADCYLTGEMSHHNVLATLSKGSHVILCEHTNTERGFLVLFADQIRSKLDNPPAITISTVDADPIKFC